MIFPDRAVDPAGPSGLAATTNAGESAVQGVDRVWEAGYGLYAAALEYLLRPEFVANLVAAVVTLAAGLLFYRVAVRLVPRVLYWRRPVEGARLGPEARAKLKRQDTAVTLIKNILKYATFLIVLLIIVSIFLRQVLPAVAGASVLAAIVVFGAQSFLRDTVAGFSILFENQFSVGDFIEVQPVVACGVVEEFGLRTTTIRTVSGELIYIPNGVMTGVTNYVGGHRWFTVEVQLRDAPAADRVVAAVERPVNNPQTSDGLFVTAPYLLRRQEFAGGVRLELVCSVLPGTEWLPREKLIQQTTAAAGEGLAAEPLAYTVDHRNIERLRRIAQED